MAKSAESANETSTKEASQTKNDEIKMDKPKGQCCPLKRLIHDIKQRGGKPSIGRLSLRMHQLSDSDRASAIKTLQSTHGNRYVQRMVDQDQPAISYPGDEYEQEANKLAEKAMGLSEAYAILGKYPLNNEKRGHVLDVNGASWQSPAAKPRTDGLNILHNVMSSSGQPLDIDTRAFMEPRFGRDFGQVRVHTGAEAAMSAKAVKALAFTIGSDIFFGQEQYAPGTLSGRSLLAHELAHVIQPHTSKGMLFRQEDPNAETARDNPRAQVIADLNKCVQDADFFLRNKIANSEVECEYEIKRKRQKWELGGAITGAFIGGQAGLTIGAIPGIIRKDPALMEAGAAGGLVSGIGAGWGIGKDVGGWIADSVYTKEDVDECKDKKLKEYEDEFEKTEQSCKERFNPENIPMPPPEKPINVEDLPIYEPPGINVEDLPIAK
ncbi:MAG: DUF4157 domain-containing protein [Methanothrix sp.]|nr:DUF4157 domain-containing protein [Methanothrix sp.]